LSGAELGELLLFEGEVIAPHNVAGFGLGDGFDAMAAENLFAFNIKPVGAAGDRAGVIDEAGIGFGVEERTDERVLLGVGDAEEDGLDDGCREGVKGGGEKMPFRFGQLGKGREVAATIGAAFVTRPAWVSGGDLGGARFDLVLKLNEHGG